MLYVQSSLKIKDLCEQHSLNQTIDEPYYFTEYSSSLLDIILLDNIDHLIFTGIADPFLTQEIRYHCPIYEMFNFKMHKHKSIFRHTWSFERGEYNSLRQKASITNWDTFFDTDINKHTQNITNHILVNCEGMFTEKRVSSQTNRHGLFQKQNDLYECA